MGGKFLGIYTHIYRYIHIYMGEKKWVKNGWNWGG